jgi:hypothetical protein
MSWYQDTFRVPVREEIELDEFESNTVNDDDDDEESIIEQEILQWLDTTGNEMIELRYVDTFNCRVQCAIENREFYIEYKCLSNQQQQQQQFRVMLDDYRITPVNDESIIMQQFIKDTNTLLKKSNNVNINNLLETCCTVYMSLMDIEHTIEQQLDPEETMKYYLNAWPVEKETGILKLDEIVQARKHIMRQLIRLSDQSCIKYSVKSIANNPFIWQIQLKDFGSESQLQKDLHAHSNKFDTNCTSIVLEMRFTDAFPNEPPLIRIVRPRLEYLSGRSNFYGMLYLDVLSDENWRWEKGNNMHDLILKLHCQLSEVQLDMRTGIPYDHSMAMKALQRMRTTNWNKLYPTCNRFSQSYIAYSSSYAKRCLGMTNAEIEDGNRIILPMSAANKIFSSPFFTTPLMFQIQTSHGTQLFCGVTEFTAPEGNVVLPQWMMKELFIKDGSQVTIRCVDLEKGSYCKLQPHSKQFYTLKNHKAVLEHVLRKFTTLTEGTSIPVPYGKKIFLVEVVELKPESAVSIVAEPYLELEIDFVPALDFEDEQVVAAQQQPATRRLSCPQIAPVPCEDGAKYSQCDNCKQHVPESNYFMHIRHCKHRVYHCTKCSNVVKHEEKEQHENEYHIDIVCDMCGISVEAYLIDDHMDSECLERILFCQYCEFPIAARNKSDHETSCGNQTQHCELCNSFIPLQFLYDHQQYCGKGGSMRSEYDCPLCDFPGLRLSELIQHLEMCHSQEDSTTTQCPICVDINNDQQEYNNLHDHLLTHHQR